jgi:valyl-tRNA synthetase
VLDTPADSVAERGKLDKERAKLDKDRDHLAQKLANPQFLERAPAAVLEKDRARLAEIESAIARLNTALARLG